MDVVHDYDAFGVPIEPTSGFGFAGEEYEVDTSLLYLRARYYAPASGRFLSPDPVLGIPNLPDSLHRYAYAANCPTRFVDPAGTEISMAQLYATAGLQIALLNSAYHSMRSYQSDPTWLGGVLLMTEAVPGGKIGTEVGTGAVKLTIGLQKIPNHSRHGLVQRFAQHVDARTYWDYFDDTLDMKILGQRILKLFDEVDEIALNLDGLVTNVDNLVTELVSVINRGKAGIGQGKVTAWEVYQAFKSPEFRAKLRLFFKGERVDVPPLPPDLFP